MMRETRTCSCVVMTVLWVLVLALVRRVLTRCVLRAWRLRGATRRLDNLLLSDRICLSIASTAVAFRLL